VLFLREALSRKSHDKNVASDKLTTKIMNNLTQIPARVEYPNTHVTRVGVPDHEEKE
jgi:hypothetical protein